MGLPAPVSLVLAATAAFAVSMLVLHARARCHFYRTLVESSPHAICVANEQGALTFANRRFAEMIGVAHAELIGTSLFEHFAGGERLANQQRFQRRRGDGGPAHDDVQLLRRDGTLIDAIQVSAPFEADGMLAVFFGDVSGRATARRALERAYEILRERVVALEGEAVVAQRGARSDLESARKGVEELATLLAAANAELETFSYSVSHDLRAPLRSIDGFTRELLRDYSDRLDARGRHYLDRVRVATVRMSHLIDDILNLSRLGRQRMRCECVDLSALAAAVAHDLLERTQDRVIEFRVEPGITAYADADLLRIVFENLLGNAVKFTAPRATAVIEVGALTCGAIFVRDNGVGFDPTYASNLFAPFQRLHSSDFEGTGIGLAIVQRIVHRHAGTIRAESVPDRGATFFLTLGREPS